MTPPDSSRRDEGEAQPKLNWGPGQIAEKIVEKIAENRQTTAIKQD